ncbi:MAG: NAD-dependent succinate-semialdehyde dehydrogenase [Arachidicoccus sp.]|nr:NAD-dependent succinate-semialdehyde dehydrogenase [Arachidicoccus sp.]
MNTFKSIFPYTQEVIAEYPLMNEKNVSNALSLSEKIYPVWSSKSYEERVGILRSVAAILKRDKNKLGALITHEMGKVVPEAVAEIEKCAWVCEYFAENAEKFLQDEGLDSDYYKSFITYSPIGAVFAVMPWNFPFWQTFRFAAPTLMAGNIALLKHAPNVTGCALAIEKIFEEAGAEKGVFQTMVIDIPLVEKIISSNIVQGVTLTGSEKAGSSVAALSGKYIKKTVMELGGSDPLIVLQDADIEQAAKIAIQSRMQNAGQSCIASKRFIVVKEAADDFTENLIKNIALLKQGNPFDSITTTGPMARLDLAQQLEKQMRDSVSKGALLKIGGEIDGCNFQPSLLMNVNSTMSTFTEEAFGPLASVIVAQNDEEAITLANKSVYGLGGSIWTRDVDRGIAIAKKINSGSIFINSLVKSDPRLPFGGIKKSGYGRELGRNGILEFVNVKTIAAEK